MNRIILSVWVVCVIGICVGSVSPNMAPPGVYNLDKLAHFFGYFTLAVLPSMLIRKLWMQAVLCVVLIVLSAGLEIAQNYIPGREGSLDDLYANALGVLTGIVLSLNVSHKKRVRRKKQRSGL